MVLLSKMIKGTALSKYWISIKCTSVGVNVQIVSCGMEVNADSEIHCDYRSLYALQRSLNISGNGGHFFRSALKIIVVTKRLENIVHARPTSRP